MTDEQIEALKKLRFDYRQTFGSDTGQRVLKDLRERFFWNDTTFKNSEKESLVNEGGRRVLLTINNMMNFPIEEIIEKGENV